MKKNLLFYSSVKNKELFDVQRFYKIDIQLLQDAGFNVILSNRVLDALLFWRYEIAFIYFYKYGFFVALFARIFNKPVYFTGGIDDLDEEYASPKAYFIQRLFFRLCNLLSTSSIIVSKADRDNVKKIYNGKLPKNISFSEHTIDVDSFNVKSDRKRQFVSIAWMEANANVLRKGVDKALYLFKFLADKPEFIGYKFVIIGKEGVGSRSLEQLATKLQIRDRITFTGSISELKKIQILSESKYYFQLSQYEGFGIAAIEALASGNIVIHSAKGGLRETMQNYGVIFDIDREVNIESEKAYCQLIQFDKDLLHEARKNLEARFSNERRRNDFIKIVKP